MRYLFLSLLACGSLGAMGEQQQFLATIARGDIAGVNSMIAAGHHVGGYTKSEPLVSAFSIENSEKRAAMVEYLLGEGADPNGRRDDRPFKNGPYATLLGYAAGAGWSREVCTFLVYGADPNGVDSYKAGALARSLQTYRSGGFLRRFKEDYQPVDTSEESMLVPKLLLMYGARADAKDDVGTSVLDFIDERDVELRSMLEDFEKYKAEHAEEFDDLENEFVALKNLRRFKMSVKRNGWFNARHGIELPFPLQGSSSSARFGGSVRLDSDENVSDASDSRKRKRVGAAEDDAAGE